MSDSGVQLMLFFQALLDICSPNPCFKLPERPPQEQVVQCKKDDVECEKKLKEGEATKNSESSEKKEKSE